MSTDTEFICEVVRVTEVLPHPDPKVERLELAHFAGPSGQMAYTCVIGKGQFKVGDLAGYMGVDCIVPKGDERFDFLFERLDGKGKDKFRVKAARIRGVYSEGFLFPVTSMSLSTPLAELLGVVYWEKPTKDTAFPVGANKSPEDRTLGGRFPIYTIDSLRKVPWLFGPNDVVEITEKIHGTNFRAGLIGGKFVVGSHRTIKTDMRGFWRRLWDRIRGVKQESAGWYAEDVYTHCAKLHGLESGMRRLRLDNHVLYGELFGVTENGAKIQDLTYDDKVMGFRLFDVWDVKRGEYLSLYEMSHIATQLGVDLVPAIASTTPWPGLDAVKALAEGKSLLAPGQIREGCVVRSVSDGRRGKWVSEAYRLRKTEES